jgi:cytochrome c-type biogenesis protein CcmH
MNAIFLASTFLMLLVALLFAAMPLIRDARSSSNGSAKLPVFVVLAALLLAIGLYAAIGRPDVAGSERISRISVAEPQRSTADAAKKAASVNELLAGLEMRLQEDPGDAKGWLLLARSYDHLGREYEAAAAYQRATQLGLTDNGLEARLR